MKRVNSVNGFVCFWSDDACLHVCNPITKEYFTTPPYSYNTNMTFFQLAAVGFGFCELSYEDKVVALYRDAECLKSGVIKPFVLTVGTDCSWRSLKAIPDTQIISRRKTSAHVKRVLYWYKKSCTHEDWPRLSKRIERLICFDVTKEEFNMIMVPAEIDGVQRGGYCGICYKIMPPKRTASQKVIIDTGVDSTLVSLPHVIQTKKKTYSSSQNFNAETPPILLATKRGSSLSTAQPLHVDLNVEFRNAIHIMTQIVATQINYSSPVNSSSQDAPEFTNFSK
ncbi:hypothetical protein BC332_07599 [Capsicum chinense]|nr:hypothetical protein BC332_07599 [Capsicum chinense]